MDRARIHERMRFGDVVDRAERSELSQMEAAELLGVSERTLGRWRVRHREDGLAGLSDRRLRPSPRRAPVVEIERMLGLYRDLHRGFTVKHFHEQLGKRHNYTLGYTVTKLHLHRAGLVTPARTRSAHRKKRPRRPMIGMLLHQDASTHAWLPGNGGKHDLVVTMDDATNALYSAFLVDEEGTASSLRGVGEVVAEHGLFCSLYTDRGSHYFLTPEAGGRVSKTLLTQFGRAFVLARAGLSRMRNLALAEPVVRYEYETPGGLLHLDIKKLGRFDRTGHRITSKRTGVACSRGSGWEFVHVCTDDASRVAFSQILLDEKKESAVAFLKAAAAYYVSLGVSVARVMTDNGFCHRSKALRKARSDLGLKHIFTRPYTPKTNGKAERSVQTSVREWAHAQGYPTSDHRAAALPNLAASLQLASPPTAG